MIYGALNTDALERTPTSEVGSIPLPEVCVPSRRAQQDRIGGNQLPDDVGSPTSRNFAQDFSKSLKVEVPPLESLFDQEDWDALLDSGDIHPDEHDVWSGLTQDYQLDQRWDKEVFQMAAGLANEANLSVDQARELRRAIIAYGGIGSTDYAESLPGKYKRKGGFGMDEVAQELGYEGDTELFLAIEDAEAILRKLPNIRGRRINQFRIKDFIGEAEEVLGNQHGRIIEAEVSDGKVPF